MQAADLEAQVAMWTAFRDFERIACFHFIIIFHTIQLTTIITALSELGSKAQEAFAAAVTKMKQLECGPMPNEMAALGI